MEPLNWKYCLPEDEAAAFKRIHERASRAGGASLSRKIESIVSECARICRLHRQRFGGKGEPRRLDPYNHFSNYQLFRTEEFIRDWREIREALLDSSWAEQSDDDRVHSYHFHLALKFYQARCFDLIEATHQPEARAA